MIDLRNTAVGACFVNRAHQVVEVVEVLHHDIDCPIVVQSAQVRYRVSLNGVYDANEPGCVLDIVKPVYADNITIGGTKHDQGKTRLDLLPFTAIQSVGDVLAHGAKKYTDHNWRKGFNYSRLIGASLRHIFAFARGENNDPESDLPHLAHAACCVLFLLEHTIEKFGIDDRPTTLKGA